MEKQYEADGELREMGLHQTRDHESPKTEQGYTKGEWKAAQYPGGWQIQVDTYKATKNFDLALVINIPEAAANARLIAAAPELYEALENLIFYASNDSVPWLMLQQAIRKGEEAIAKVE